MQTGWKYVRNQLLVIVAVILLSVLFLILGLMLGYSVFGQGDNPLSVLSLEKWQSILAKFTG